MWRGNSLPRAPFPGPSLVATPELRSDPTYSDSIGPRTLAGTLTLLSNSSTLPAGFSLIANIRGSELTHQRDCKFLL